MAHVFETVAWHNGMKNNNALCGKICQENKTNNNKGGRRTDMGVKHETNFLGGRTRAALSVGGQAHDNKGRVFIL